MNKTITQLIAKRFGFSFSIHQALAIILTIVALAVGQSAWAMSSFTVSSPQDNNTFRITRTGNTAVAETIDWRVVSLSAIAGVHFTGYQGNYSGQVTFAAGDPYKDVTISENTPGDNAYKYQNGSDRSYRFEVLDKNGDILASKDRTITSGLTQFSAAKVSSSISNLVTMSSGNFSSGMSSSKYLDVNFTLPSGYVEADNKNSLEGYVLIDDEYDYTTKPAYVSTSTLISNTGASASYLKALGYKIYATVCFTEKERDDGYQYLQIIAGNSAHSYDGADSNGMIDNGPTNSVYKVCYELADGSNSTGKAYFPHRGTGTDEFSLSTGKLWQQKYKSGYDGNGSVILDPDVSYITTRFDAGGENNDTWGYKDFFVRMALCDATKPTVLNNDYKVSGGRHQKGNTIYVSVPFKEIVTVTGTPTLASNWGTLSYIAGSGSNVLTFKGTIDPTDNNSFSVSSYSLNGGTIKDLAGNSFSGSISHSFGTTLDSEYAWSTSDFNSLNDGSYEIYTTQDLRHLALMVNSGNNNCSGLTFKQRHDITYTHTTTWDDATSQENNYTAIGTTTNTFQGTFDGQNHTICGIRIYKGGGTNADDSQGLFGKINYGTVKGVNLSDTRITGADEVGGIAGLIFETTIKGCTVAANVCIHSVQSISECHGGIVGINQGTMQRCLSRARLTVTDASYCENYGAVVGQNQYGEIKDCIVIGATVPNVDKCGAITGYHYYQYLGNYIQRNYYRGCTVAGTVNATGVGVGYEDSSTSPHDVTANQGAQALYSLTLPSGVSLERTASANLPGTGNATYTTGADIDGTPYAFAGATLSFSYTGAAPANGYKTAIYVNGVQATDNGDGTYTATMPAEDATITVTQVAIPWSGSGNSANDPYLIKYPSQLDLLATNVNAGNSYSGKYFSLANDITYSHTTNWNNSSSTESNYTAIGTDSNKFCGTFDGRNFTISGIRIYKGGSNGDNYNQGLFGDIGSGGIVRGVNLADARITGHNSVGGIAGKLFSATVEDCTVAANVCIHAVQFSSYYHGGIVGFSQGTVRRCISRATLTVATDADGNSYGAITGDNTASGHSVKDCIAVGATVPNVNNAGAIIGNNNENSSTHVQRNYYRACTVAGVANATGVGVGYDKNSKSPHDVTENQGALALYSLTLPSGVSLERTKSATLPGTGNATYTTGADIDGTPYAFAGAIVTLAFAGGSPQGLVYSVNGTPIEGSSFEMPAAEVTVTVNGGVSYIDADGTARNAVATSLSGSETTLGTANETTWYVASSDISFDHEVLIYGDVRLILADGITMTMTERDNNKGCISGYNHNLTIYGQSEGTGTLIATNKNSLALGVNNLTINGGRITATSNYDAIIAGNNLTINGGVINATSQVQNGIFSFGGNLTINGGLIISTGYPGLYSLNDEHRTGSIIINGGRVETNSMFSKTIILGYSNDTDYIKIGSDGCFCQQGIFIAAGKSMTDSTNTYTAPANYNMRIGAELANVTLRPVIPASVEPTLAQGTKDGVTAYWGTFYDKAAGYSLPAGATAYTMDENKNLYRLGTDGSMIPKGVPVVIISEVADITLTKVDGEITATDNAPGGNILLGTNGLVELEYDPNDDDFKVDGKIPYVLSLSAGEIGFRQFTGDAIPAHKAYYIE